MFTKQKISYYIGVMMMLSSLLMILANNVPIVLSYRWVWAPVSMFFVVLSDFKLLQNKQVYISLIYGILFCGFLQYFVWNNMLEVYKGRILEDFYALFPIVFFYAFLVKNKYFFIWSKIAKIGLIAILITGVMTIIATDIDPMCVRNSYSYPERISAIVSVLGFGSYTYMISIVALLPFFVYWFKKSSNNSLRKYVKLLILFFLYFVLIRSQIFANILVATIFIIFAFSGIKNIKKLVIIFGLIAIVLSIPRREFYADQLKGLSKSFDYESNIYYKLNDMSTFILNPEIEDNETEFSSRAERYFWLWDALMNRPVLGDASGPSYNTYQIGKGFHVYWMSRLALWGIFGFMGYLLILRNIFIPVIRMFDEEFRFYYLLSLFSVIALGFLKNIAGREMYIVLLIIIPGIYYIPLLKKGKYTNKTELT